VYHDVVISFLKHRCLVDMSILNASSTTQRRDSPAFLRLWQIIDFLWICVLIAYILLGVPQTPFHGDESTLVYNTHDYAAQFIRRDLSAFDYASGNVNPMDADLMLLDGRVHKYLGGLFWHLSGYTEVDLNQPWLWGADMAFNQANGHVPSEGLLVVTRLASAVLMAVGVPALFGIGLRLDGRVTAYAATLVYALAPALLLNGRRSMMEGALMGFTLLTVLAALLFAKRRDLGSALLLGLSGGMALASKHTGLLPFGLVIAGFGLGLLIEVAVRKSLPLRSLWRSAALLVVSGLIAGGVFLAFNPAWWRDPLGTVREVTTRRTTLLESQTAFYGGYSGLGERLRGFYDLAIIGAPQYFEAGPEWQDYIGDEIAVYEASPWKGISPGIVALIILFPAGLWSLWRGINSQQIERRLIHWIAAVWIVGICAAVVVVTPLEWQRYYLPAITALCLLSGLGVGQIARWLLPYINRPAA
jgi:hypothetical protein